MTFPRRTAVSVIVAGALGALALLYGQFWLMRELSWTHRLEPADSLIGFNFSCDQAEYLLLEDPAKGADGYVSDDRPGRAEWCGEVLGRLIDETSLTLVRISVQWDDVEPREGEYDFSLADELVRVARARGARLSVSVGMKAQRHPEFYIPAWALEGVPLQDGEVLSERAALRERALRMVAAVVMHYAGEPTIDSWSAENEPYIASHRSEHVSLSPEYVAEVVETIHENDPLGRPVVINHAQHFVMGKHWRDALADGDILAHSMYPRRNIDFFGLRMVANIMELGPLMPNYAYQADLAHAAGKEFWVTELQGEPWTDVDSRLISPANPSANLSPQALQENVIDARKSGAERIYLWGAEWWLYQAEHFADSRWLQTARSSTGSR